MARRTCRTSFRTPCATIGVRCQPRSGRPPCHMGVLSRAPRIDNRCACTDRGAGRAFRTGISRPNRRPPRNDGSPTRSAQSQFGGWRYRRRSKHAAPVVSPAHIHATPLPYGDSERLSLLRVDTARWRRTRHVRPSRRAGGPSRRSIEIASGSCSDARKIVRTSPRPRMLGCQRRHQRVAARHDESENEVDQHRHPCARGREPWENARENVEIEYVQPQSGDRA